MKSKAKQYTIRNVPPSVDSALRKKAAEKHTSLNSLLLEALEREVGMDGNEQSYHDLDRLIGSWVSDPKCDQALKDQRKIHKRDWE